MIKTKFAVTYAILAAALYAINVPLSKILLEHIQPMMMAGLLYLGTGAGMGILMLCGKMQNKKEENLIGKSDLGYTTAMIFLDVAAPIFLMYGILHTNSANVSLLNNFEIVATSLIALLVFKEKISLRLWTAIVLVTAGSIILGFEGEGAFVLNKGSLFVMCACLCWGIENNCTRRLSDKSSKQIVLIKGIFSGLGSIIVAIISKEAMPEIIFVLIVMLLGFVSYGLSINFYIKAQSCLGAAKTSAFYSIAPFLGVAFSFILLMEKPQANFYTALVMMIIGTILMTQDSLKSKKE